MNLTAKNSFLSYSIDAGVDYQAHSHGYITVFKPKVITFETEEAFPVGIYKKGVFEAVEWGESIIPPQVAECIGCSSEFNGKFKITWRHLYYTENLNFVRK